MGTNKDRIWLSSPTMHGEELQYMKEAYETNWMSTIGANIDAIEEMVCSKIECGNALAVSSGTAAIHLAVKLAGERLYGKPRVGHGVLEGRKVFCSDLTFDATVNPIAYEGGESIFIDSEYETWNMDPKALERAFKLYPEVKIVVLVHLYGTPAKIDEIRSVCKSHDALLIEDAAESLGATYKEKQTGGFGAYGIISFNGNKIITGSSGGMLLTDDNQEAAKAKKWSTQSRESAAWYQHEELGYNYRMSNVIAGVIRGQYLHLEEHILQKKEIWERYKKGLQSLPVKMNPFDANTSEPNYWLSCMLIDLDAMCPQTRTGLDASYTKKTGCSCPTEILEKLSAINAEGRPIWKPMHMQPIYSANAFVAVEDGNDVGADLFDRGICLPSDNKMTIAQQESIIATIISCFDK